MMNHYVVDQSVEFGFQTRLINTSVNHVMFCSLILSEESEEASHKCFLFSRIKNEKKISLISSMIMYRSLFTAIQSLSLYINICIRFRGNAHSELRVRVCVYFAARAPTSCY